MCYIHSAMEGELSRALIIHGLKTSLIGRRVLYRAVVSSTMDVARAEALKGGVEGTVVVAKRQTAGRGRMGRRWLSPEGILAVSVVLYPRPDILPRLTMLAAVSVVEAVRTAAGLEARLKWPNDVLIGDKKIAGILAESGTAGGSFWAVVGIGVNVNNSASGLGAVAYPATSLRDELGESVPILKLLASLLGEMDRLYVSGDWAGIYNSWRNKLATLGKKVSVGSGDSVYRGLAESVDPNGNLILRLDGGKLASFCAGDVTLRES